MQRFIAASFADAAAARSAAERLADAGLPRDSIAFHEGTAVADNAASLEIDEVVTGGFLGSFSSLLQGLFGEPVAKGDAARYDDLVRSEGALLTIDLDHPGEVDADRCETILRDGGAVRVSRMPQEMSVSQARHGPGSS